jgi:hypothetical protein
LLSREYIFANLKKPISNEFLHQVPTLLIVA